MKSQEIKDRKKIDAIINSSDVCYIGFVDGDMPYVLPFNFGYKDNHIWLHSGKTGRKLDILKKNPNVSIAFSIDHKLHFQSSNVGCSYSMKFKSVIVTGKVEIIEDFDEKVEGIKIVMANYSDLEFTFSTPSINGVEVFKVEILSISARHKV